MNRTSTLLACALCLFAAPSFASLLASPSFVEFGSLQPGQSQSETVFVTNEGPRPISISSFDNCFADDVQVSNFCMGELLSYSDCTITLNFEPRSAGYKSCTITVSGSDGSMASISVSGQGEAAP